MATVTTRVDDVDGSTEGVETLRLTVGDRTVDIDLSQANRDKLAKAVAPFMDKGREVVKKAGNSETAVMREWLQAHGHKVGDKGRIPEDLQAIYHEANAS